MSGREPADDSNVEPVQVFVRIRPIIPEDLLLNTDSDAGSVGGSSSIGTVSTRFSSGARHKTVTKVDDKTLRVDPPETVGSLRKSVAAVDSKLFSYDSVFGEGTTQDEIYSSVMHHVKATIRGYNTTIFALGCTGSGKTFTMTGNQANPGIVPRAVSDLFATIQATAEKERDVYFYVRVSLVELYNNSFRNLLDFASKELAAKEITPSASVSMSISAGPGGFRSHSPSVMHPSITKADKIEVRESPSAGVYLSGQHLRIPVTTAQEAFQLISTGMRNRATGATNCNDVSSRSHCILTLHVESRISTGSDGASSELRVGKMHLIDLAGSERLKLSGAEGDALTETQNINLSLTALGDVLAALSHNAKEMSRSLTAASSSGGSGGASHSSVQPSSSGVTNRASAPPALVPVPYRNSKLTHLLKDSLGGNSKTTMITTICTSVEYFQQTLISLNYASRAKKVRNRSLVNRDVIGDSGIHAVTLEIERLKSRLDERTSEFDRLKLEHQRDATENVTLKQRLQELNKMNEEEKRQLERQMSHVIHSQAGQLESQRQRINALQSALQDELALSHSRIAEQEREIKWLKKALDDSTQAVQLPVQQIERMQKVIDAWETQAKNAQTQLGSVSAELKASQTSNASLRDELAALQSQYRSCAQEEVELRARVHAEAEARVAAERSRAATMEMCSKLQGTITLLQEEYRNREAQTVEASRRHAKAENDLRDELEASQRLVADLNRKVSDLEAQNSQLRERLTTSVASMELQLRTVIEESKSSVKQSEMRAEVAERRTKSIEQELDVFKQKLSGVQMDTHDIVSQRDAKIIELLAQLRQVQSSKDETTANYESRLSAASMEISRLQAELSASESSLTTTQEELSRKKREFYSQLEAKMVEVENIRRNFSDKLAFSEAEYEERLSEVERSRQVKILELKKQCADEVEAAKEEYNRIATAEIQRISNELIEVHNASRLQLDELSYRHAEELRLARESFDASMREAERLKAAEHSEALRRTEARFEAEVAELRRSMEALRGEHESEVEVLKMSFAQELSNERSRWVSEQAVALERAREQMKLLASKETEDTLDEAYRNHQSELQRLQRDYDASLAQVEEARVREVRELESSLHSEYEQREALLRADYESRMVAVRTEAETAMAEVKQVYQRKLKAASEGLSKQLDGMTKHREDLERTMEDLVVAAREEERLKYTASLASELEALKAALNVQHESAISELRSNLRSEFDSNLATLSEKWRVSSETSFEERLAASLTSQKEELERLHLEKTRDIEAMHKGELDKLQVENTRAKDEALAELSTRLTQEKESALRALEFWLSAESDASLRQASVTHQESLEKLESEYNARIQSLESELSHLRESSSSQLHALREKLRESEETHSATVIDLQEAFDAALRRTQTQFEAEKDAILSAHESSASKEMSSIMDLHKKELSSMKENYESQIDDIRTKNSAAMRELTSKYEKQLEDMQHDFEARLQQQRTALLSEKLELSESVRHELVQLQTDNRQALVDAEVRHNQQLEVLLEAQKKSFLEKEEEMVKKYSRDLALAVAEAIEKNELQHSEVVKKMSLDGDAKQNELKEMYESKFRLQELEHESKIRELNATIVTLNEQLNELNAVRKSSAVASRAEIAALKEHYMLEITSLKNAHSAELEVSISSLTSAHESQVRELRNLLDASELRTRELMAAHSAEMVSREEHFNQALSESNCQVRKECEAMYEKQLTELNSFSNDAFSKQLEAVRAMYDARIDGMVAQHKVATATAIAEKAEECAHMLDVEVQRVRASHESELMQLKADSTERIRLLVDQEREQSALAIAEMQRSHEALMHGLERQLAEERARHTTELETAYTKHAQEVREMMDQQERMRSSDLQESESIMSDLKSSYEMRIASLKAEVSRLCASFDSEKERFARDLEDTAQTSRQAAIDELSAQHEKEIETINRDWGHKLSEALRVQDAESQERLNAQLGQVVQQLDSRVTELQGTHRAERAKLHDKIAQLEEELSSSRTRSITLETRIGELEAELSVEKTTRQAQFDSEIEATRRQSDVELRAATDSIQQERERRLKLDAELSSRVAQLSAENDALKSTVSQLDGVVNMLKTEAVNDRVDFEAQIRTMRAAHDQELEAASKVREKLEADVVAVRDRLAATHKEHENRVAELDARHRSEMDRLQALLRDESERYRQLIANIEGKKMDDLNLQVQELFKLMQSTYEESKLNVPKVEELHSKFIDFISQNSEHNKNTAEFSSYEPSSRPASRVVGPSDDVSEHGSFRMSHESHASAPNSSWTVHRTDLNKLPPDQLTAAILEGDVQGIRTIVRSKGDSLHSPYWIEVSKSILPLHRAIAGLHFHGNDSMLIATIECLTQLGCNVKATDHSGNTCVHKAIQVCTSTSIAAVLKALLSKGASASAKNRHGDAPIHMECRRLRVASPDVIACLIAHGADVNSTCIESSQESLISSSGMSDVRATTAPLAMVLAAAAELHAPQSSLSGRPRAAPVLLSVDDPSMEGPANEDRPPRAVANGVRRTWTQLASALVRAGAKFDVDWAQKQTNNSMLHLLLQAFPPPRDQAMAYRSLVLFALKSGCSPLAPENEAGHSPLHLFCYRLACVTPDSYSDAGNVLHALLQACDTEPSRDIIIRPDRCGVSILDIPESTHGSWLSLSRPLLADTVSRRSRRGDAGHVSYFSAVPVHSMLMRPSMGPSAGTHAGRPTSTPLAMPAQSTPGSSAYLSKSIGARMPSAPSSYGIENAHGNSNMESPSALLPPSRISKMI